MVRAGHTQARTLDPTNEDITWAEGDPSLPINHQDELFSPRHSVCAGCRDTLKAHNALEMGLTIRRWGTGLTRMFLRQKEENPGSWRGLERCLGVRAGPETRQRCAES